MPTLYLSPRHSPESTAVIIPAAKAGWSVRRLASYEVPHDALGTGGAYYGETMFGYAVASQIGLQLSEPAPEWLPELPEEHRLRTVQLAMLPTVSWDSPLFVKSTGEKSFAAGVYSAAPPSADHDEPVLVSEPCTSGVRWRSRSTRATVHPKPL